MAAVATVTVTATATAAVTRKRHRSDDEVNDESKASSSPPPSSAPAPAPSMMVANIGSVWHQLSTLSLHDVHTADALVVITHITAIHQLLASIERYDDQQSALEKASSAAGVPLIATNGSNTNGNGSGGKRMKPKSFGDEDMERKQRSSRDINTRDILTTRHSMLLRLIQWLDYALLWLKSRILQPINNDTSSPTLPPSSSSSEAVATAPTASVSMGAYVSMMQWDELCLTVQMAADRLIRVTQLLRATYTSSADHVYDAATCRSTYDALHILLMATCGLPTIGHMVTAIIVPSASLLPSSSQHTTKSTDNHHTKGDKDHGNDSDDDDPRSKSLLPPTNYEVVESLLELRDALLGCVITARLDTAIDTTELATNTTAVLCHDWPHTVIMSHTHVSSTSASASASPSSSINDSKSSRRTSSNDWLSLMQHGVRKTMTTLMRVITLIESRHGLLHRYHDHDLLSTNTRTTAMTMDRGILRLLEFADIWCPHVVPGVVTGATLAHPPATMTAPATKYDANGEHPPYVSLIFDIINMVGNRLASSPASMLPVLSSDPAALTSSSHLLQPVFDMLGGRNPSCRIIHMMHTAPVSNPIAHGHKLLILGNLSVLRAIVTRRDTACALDSKYLTPMMKLHSNEILATIMNDGHWEWRRYHTSSYAMSSLTRALFTPTDLRRICDECAHHFPPMMANQSIDDYIHVNCQLLCLPSMQSYDVTYVRTMNGREMVHAANDGRSEHQLLADGYTMVIKDVARYHGAVGALSEWMASRIGCRVCVNAYWTPPNSQGFAAHVDDHCVMAIQCYGSKQWRVGDDGDTIAAATRLPLLYAPRAVPDTTRTPTTVVTMNTGDVLYVPRGVVHSAVTATIATPPAPTLSNHMGDSKTFGTTKLPYDGYSLHLTFGLEVDVTLTLGAAIQHLAHLMMIRCNDDDRYQWFTPLHFGAKTANNNNAAACTYADLFHIMVHTMRTNAYGIKPTRDNDDRYGCMTMGATLRKSNPQLIHHDIIRSNKNSDTTSATTRSTSGGGTQLIAALHECCSVMLRVITTDYRYGLPVLPWSHDSLHHLLCTTHWGCQPVDQTRARVSKTSSPSSSTMVWPTTKHMLQHKQVTMSLAAGELSATRLAVWQRLLTNMQHILHSYMSDPDTNTDATHGQMLDDVYAHQRAEYNRMATQRSDMLRFFQTIHQPFT